MCDKIAAIASLAVQVAQLGAGMAQGMNQYDPSADIYLYQQQIAQNQAITANRLAQRELDQAAHEERMLRRDRSRQGGRITATLAAGGVMVDSGSPLQVIQDHAEDSEIAALEIRSDGEFKAWRNRLDAYNHTNEARLLGFRASTTPRNDFDPFGHILDSAPGLISGAKSVRDAFR